MRRGGKRLGRARGVIARYGAPFVIARPLIRCILSHDDGWNATPQDIKPKFNVQRLEANAWKLPCWAKTKNVGAKNENFNFSHFMIKGITWLHVLWVSGLLIGFYARQNVCRYDSAFSLNDSAFSFNTSSQRCSLSQRLIKLIRYSTDLINSYMLFPYCLLTTSIHSSEYVSSTMSGMGIDEKKNRVLTTFVCAWQMLYHVFMSENGWTGECSK